MLCVGDLFGAPVSHCPTVYFLLPIPRRQVLHQPIREFHALVERALFAALVAAVGANVVNVDPAAGHSIRWQVRIPGENRIACAGGQGGSYHPFYASSDDLYLLSTAVFSTFSTPLTSALPACRARVMNS